MAPAELDTVVVGVTSAEEPVPSTFVEQIEAVAETSSAEESAPVAPAELDTVVVGVTSAEEPVPSTFVEQIEAVVEITPAEDPAPVTPAEPVEVVTGVAPAEESAPVASAEPSESVAEITPTEEPAPVISVEQVEVVTETTPDGEAAPATFFGRIIKAVTEIMPVERFVPVTPVGPVETVVEIEPTEEPAHETPASPNKNIVEVAPAEEPAPATLIETVVEIVPVEKPIFEQVEVVEEAPIVERGLFATVVEESVVNETAEPPVQQTPIGSAFANFFAATTGFGQNTGQSGNSETEIIVQSKPVESAAPAAQVEFIEQISVIEPATNVDELSLFEQVAVLNLEETDYASQDMFASIDVEDTSEKPQTGDLADLALFQAPPEQGSFDPYPDSTIEAPGETLLAMGEVFTSTDSESYPSSSGEFGKHDPSPDPNNPPKGIFGGKKGISLFNTNPANSTSAEVVTGLSVNSFLWRATLDTLSFMPLASADPFGGVVITDWHNNPQAPAERFKVVAYILDKDLRVGALRVSVFRQEQSTTGIWTDAVTDENVHIQLETTILSRARELRTLWLDQQQGG